MCKRRHFFISLAQVLNSSHNGNTQASVSRENFASGHNVLFVVCQFVCLPLQPRATCECAMILHATIIIVCVCPFRLRCGLFCCVASIATVLSCIPVFLRCAFSHSHHSASQCFSLVYIWNSARLGRTFSCLHTLAHFLV